MVHPDDLPRVLDAPPRRRVRVAGLGLRIPGPPARRRLPLARLALGAGLRRARAAGAPRRRQLGRHRDQARRARAPAGRPRRARDPGQVAVPLAHEPRAAHAAERGARLHPAAPDRGPPLGRGGAARQARPHPRCRRPSALADQRRARPLRPRIGRAQAGAAARSTSAMLVRQSVPLVESLAAQHGVVVEIGRAGARRAPTPTRLRQVLINLLSNAIKYNRRGGRVVVARRSRRRPGHAARCATPAAASTPSSSRACSSRSTASAPRTKASKAPASA